MSEAGGEYATGLSRTELAAKLADISPAIDQALALPVARLRGNAAHGFGLSGQDLIGVSRYLSGANGNVYLLTVYDGDDYPRNPSRAKDKTVLSWWVSEEGTLDESTISLAKFSTTGNDPAQSREAQDAGIFLVDLMMAEGIEWFSPDTHRVGFRLGPCGPEAQIVPKRSMRRTVSRIGRAMLAPLRR